jgi:cytoskeletal protein RodZ
MINLHKYLFICVLAIFVIGVFKYYRLNEEFEELTLKYTQLQSQYIVEKANTSALENSLKTQNMLIETYKESSKTYEKTINKLNESIKDLNDINVKYEASDNKNATSEEAIQWLRDKSSSLSR